MPQEFHWQLSNWVGIMSHSMFPSMPISMRYPHEEGYCESQCERQKQVNTLIEKSRAVVWIINTLISLKDEYDKTKESRFRDILFPHKYLSLLFWDIIPVLWRLSFLGVWTRWGGVEDEPSDEETVSLFASFQTPPPSLLLGSTKEKKDIKVTFS